LFGNEQEEGGKGVAAFFSKEEYKKAEDLGIRGIKLKKSSPGKKGEKSRVTVMKGEVLEESAIEKKRHPFMEEQREAAESSWKYQKEAQKKGGGQWKKCPGSLAIVKESRTVIVGGGEERAVISEDAQEKKVHGKNQAGGVAGSSKAKGTEKEQFSFFFEGRGVPKIKIGGSEGGKL